MVILGYDHFCLLEGKAKDSPRKEFLYWSDDGELMAIRYEQWKVAFKEQCSTVRSRRASTSTR